MDFSQKTIQSSKLCVQIIPYGARIQSISLIDNKQQKLIITGGYHEIKTYALSNNYYGAICGRNANRIKNGRFTLNTVNYQLDINHGHHHLHGGHLALHNKNWELLQQNEDSISYHVISPDGDMGYPGALEIILKYSLENEDTLRMDYEAVSSKDTILNLAPHSYFNLNGDGLVLDHSLQIQADHFTPIDNECIPTGQILSVANTAFDFRIFKKIGEEINTNDIQLQIPTGYDHNYVLRQRQFEHEPVAMLHNEHNSRMMEIYTSQPGLQFYTCNWPIDQTEIGYKGKVYQRHSFVCLEPQHFPDSPHHHNFPSTILKAGEKYKHFTKYKFIIS